MSSVSRRESPLTSSDLSVPQAQSHDAPASTAARPPASVGLRTGGEAPRAVGPQRNQVETYRGPVERSPPERAPAGGEGGGGLTAGQLALGGAKARDAVQADAAYAEIRSLLHTDWKDWSITLADRRQVHDQLERLAPADYARTLERMDQAGLLGRYLDPEKLEPAGARAFLNQAERKGVLSIQSGPKAPPVAGRPPDAPSFYRNEARLPDSVRELVHASNLGAKRTYADAHQAYVRRYAEQAMGAKDVLALRELGAPVGPFSLSEPGVTAAHPDERRLRASWARVSLPDATLPAYRAVDARLRDLSNSQRAGTLQFRQEVELGVETEGVTRRVSREDGLTAYGRHDSTLKEGLELVLHGQKVGVERDSAGAVTTERGVDVDGSGVSVDSEGTVRLELSVPGSEGHAVYSEFNPSRGTFGGGLSVEQEVGEARARLEYGVTMQGARAERARDIASREPGTVFGPLPELERGLAWAALPEERRARMVRDGWSAESWAGALQREAARR